jgi:ABC-type transport system involved in cytochrome c biogenesis permease component
MDMYAEYGLVSIGLVFTLAGLFLLIAALARRKSRTAIYAAAILAIGALLLGRLGYAEFWRVDRCLDAGGSYEYQAGACRHDSYAQ